eukprot:CAMPEP_0185757362 /NCGR_PEP_ID=MMETSP1174-20130828/15842_1 /TAXON_ID=35687 /ORGANISM="Dictyocha speculum, Strain CCMP1381" /LENGTH=50 /DNA_ID=CAMNT_0028436747 /DNA_START=12 /DNA_END=160 /DNA_ORIENTATION=+
MAIREQIAEEMALDLSAFLNENGIILEKVRNSQVETLDHLMPAWQHLEER